MTAPARAARIQNNAAGLPAEDERLITAFFTPGSGLHARTGIWPAAAGYMGEVTLLSDTQVQINPFRATVVGTQSGVQGDYTVVNDAVRTSTIGPRDATNTRLDLLVTRVRDTAYTPNEGANDVRYAEVLPGTPAAVPAAPGTPPNALVHGTITVPASGAVTYTSAATGLVVALGGIRPVAAADAAAPVHIGQYRDHPTRGLQRGAGGAWGLPAARSARFASTGPGGATGIVRAAGSAWDVSGSEIQNLGGGLAAGSVTVTAPAFAVTDPAGNITNGPVAALSAPWLPLLGVGYPIQTTASGRMAMGYINSAGEFIIAALAPGANVASGETFQLGGIYPLTDPYAGL